MLNSFTSYPFILAIGPPALFVIIREIGGGGGYKVYHKSVNSAVLVHMSPSLDFAFSRYPLFRVF